MTDLESKGKDIPEAVTGNDTAKVASPEEVCQAVLINDEDIFLKKIFKTSPYTAFDLLFKKYYSVLCNHAVRFVYSKQKAEDIVSDVFLLFWKGKLYDSVTKSYRTYLFTAVRNKCLTHLKTELTKLNTGDISELNICAGSTPEEILFASDLHIKIEKTIKSLPARRQQVFVMSRYEAKKNITIARELNLSMKTVEMHISKALAALRKIVP